MSWSNSSARRWIGVEGYRVEQDSWAARHQCARQVFPKPAHDVIVRPGEFPEYLRRFSDFYTILHVNKTLFFFGRTGRPAAVWTASALSVRGNTPPGLWSIRSRRRSRACLRLVQSRTPWLFHENIIPLWGGIIKDDHHAVSAGVALEKLRFRRLHFKLYVI